MRSRPIIGALAFLLVSSFVFLSADGFSYLSDPVELHILLQIKLPVLFTAILVGGAIALSSATLQVLLRNPLADPGIIGISAGASLMAAVVLLTGSITLGSNQWASLSYYMLPLACFVGAMISSFLIFALARKLQASMSSVILAGIGISTIAGAIIGWLYLYAPPQSIKNLSFWLMGSLHNTNYISLLFAAPLILIPAVLLMLQTSKLNWLYLGASAAQLRGLEPKKFERNVLILCALLIGTSVSIAGSIAFIGLLIPHFVRQFWGHDNRIVMPMSGLLGAGLLIFTASINEWVFEFIVPVSMLTASIGGPLFIYSLLKQQRLH
ncbi:MAG: iron ABC transporter permease [Glaciecola sp.]|jgi:iron complex transport system permease protein